MIKTQFTPTAILITPDAMRCDAEWSDRQGDHVDPKLMDPKQAREARRRSMARIPDPITGEVGCTLATDYPMGTMRVASTITCVGRVEQ